jgi:DNA-binding ferritin-like protein
MKKLAFAEPEREFAANTLAMLRGLSWLYQTAHWQALGDLFYQDHLLFERLYGNVEGEVDGLAEKIIGLYGFEIVSAPDIVARTAQFVNTLWPVANPFERTLKAEHILLGYIQDELEQDGIPTGYRVFLEDILSKHDENLYLIQQRLGSAGVSATIVPQEEDDDLEGQWFGEE